MRPIAFLLCILGLTFASAFSSSPSPSCPSISTSPSRRMPPRASKVGAGVEPRALIARCGATKTTGGSIDESNGRSAVQLASSIYGTGGVVYILVKAIRRVVPIALEPFSETATPLSQVQLGVYISTCLWFAYVEGYKGFQTKFSPLVVSRSLTLKPGVSSFHHYLLAPLYSMGLFHATKKRMIVSWSVTLGVAGIVAAVKKLPYPWRNIVDAGVVAGLTWGCISILVHYIKALATGKSPADPALPKAD